MASGAGAQGAISLTAAQAKAVTAHGSTSSPPMKIAVMTSGGDSPGMNAGVRSVVKMAIHKGCQAYIIREGWEGLVRGNDPEEEERGKQDGSKKEGQVGLLREGVSEASGIGLKGRYIVQVQWDDVRGWMSEGGTLIGTARCAEFRERGGRLKAAHNLVKHGIDALVVIGGDGSISGADRLKSEWSGLLDELRQAKKITDAQFEHHTHLRISSMVGSIDMDFCGVDACIGSATALRRICEMVDSISSTASSHSRAFVCVVMGRASGWLALQGGIAVGADHIFVPERPPESDDWREEMCAGLKAHRAIGKRKTIVMVAEGAVDKFLNRIDPEEVRKCLEEKLGLESRLSVLGHAQRGGKPVGEDRILATLQGVEAVNVLLEAKPETPSYVIGIREDKVIRLPLVQAVEQTRLVATHIEKKQFSKALALRDQEFIEGLTTFDLVSQIDENTKLPTDKRMRMAIMHVGAPAGGMNAATRTAVRYCIARGHTPLLVLNGFPGLLDDAVEEPTWLQVDNWAIRGGSELGTNRHLPNNNFEGVAAALQRHKVQALMLIGGFEAFMSVKLLSEERGNHAAFRIPILQIPATLSSNIPLTESLGFSTSLNEVVNAADILKGSASASRSRVFMLSCQGGKAGQLAVSSALAAGAVLAYTPEVGISLQQLDGDVGWLRKRYQMDVKGKSEGRLVIVSDKASDAFSIDTIASIFNQEAQDLYSVRSSNLGHLCQGSTPSPMDRCRAARLARHACEFLEKQAHQGTGGNASSQASIICINGSRISFVSAAEMAEQADIKNRRGKEVPWHGMKELVDLMAGRHLFDV